MNKNKNREIIYNTDHLLMSIKGYNVYVLLIKVLIIKRNEK